MAYCSSIAMVWVLEEPLTDVAVLAPGDLDEVLRPGDLEESFDQCYVHKVEEIYSLGEVKIWDWAPVKESAYAVGETVMELEVEMEEELMTS